MKEASDGCRMPADGMKSAICGSVMQTTGLLPKKFEIQFRLTGEDEYTGVLLIEGMEMGVGTPKTLDEITAFLMPSLAPYRPSLDQTRT